MIGGGGGGRLVGVGEVFSAGAVMVGGCVWEGFSARIGVVG